MTVWLFFQVHSDPYFSQETKPWLVDATCLAVALHVHLWTYICLTLVFVILSKWFREMMTSFEALLNQTLKQNKIKQKH